MSSHSIRLDTIFVDEFFGTLDPAPLEFTIRTLKDVQQPPAWSASSLMQTT
jgi:hypothetical protein